MAQFTISQLNTKDGDYTIQDTDVVMITVGTQTTDLSSVRVSFKQFADWIVETYAANHGVHITGNVACSGLSAIGSSTETIRFAQLTDNSSSGGRTKIDAMKTGDIYAGVSGTNKVLIVK
jgi:hypothetical protein